MADGRKLSINQVTLLEQWSFAESIDGLCRHGIPATSIWRDKLLEIGLAKASRLLRESGLGVSGYCPGGMLTAPDTAALRARIDENRRMIEEAAACGAPCLVMPSGGLPQGSKGISGAREQCLEGLAELLPVARAAGVTLALEPLHPMQCAARSVLATLGEALDWCERLGGGPEVGVVVDAYHVWWDPDLAKQIVRAGSRIAAFHMSDFLLDTRDLRLDRGMMGDGVIDLPRVRSLVEAAGFDGYHEIEIFSRDNWWKRDPDEVVEVIKDRHRTCC